ncbi:F-box protein At2g23160-like [Triticum urartu]|uniref:F-box protein At2g23160-like n=1 Tax=Triticum urartu TaxID=4572 RepID=UPI0020447BF5|nr:F-box protein At2g23160-like [Triticum urartu]XP_048547277.1 F-box protein At2g23160-like [Triticum urartu]
MEEAEKGEIFEWNTKPSSMEEMENGEIFEWNTKTSSMEEAEKGEIFERNTKPRLDDHPQATVAGAASLLNVDLILEILSRLPARSVHRFRCVSVLGRDLIADPTNCKKLPQTLAGFLYTSFYSSGYRHHFTGFSNGASPFVPSLPYLHPNKDEGITQVDACNDLLLYSRYNSRDDYHFVVCNPATGRWVELPPQPQTQEPMHGFNHTAGLAFDPVEPGVRGNGIVEKATLFRSECVFVGSMLYIMGNLEDINSEYVLVGVDMEGKGYLHYAIAPVNNNNELLVSEIALWCLKDCDSNQWVQKHTASIDELMSMTGQKYRVVGIHPDCDTIFLAQCGEPLADADG